jgi:chromosome partitioning protein
MAVHIAAGLAIRGARVGLVDTDSQGHAGLMLGMPETNGLFAALIEKKGFEETVFQIPAEHLPPPDMNVRGSLYLLPSGDLTYKIPYELQAGDAFAFLELVEAFIEWAALDLVIIDTNPTMSMFDGAVYMATDGFIFVTECERLSFDGIGRATEQIIRFSKSRDRYLGRGSRLIGIIPNKMRADTVVHRTNISDLKQVYGETVWTPVTYRIAWASALNIDELVYSFEPAGQAAHDAWHITEQVGKAVRLWQIDETG